jgi:hypothetical protein
MPASPYCLEINMSYSDRAPNEPGYYWLKRDGNEEIVEVWTDPNQAVAERAFHVHHCGSGDATEVVTIERALWAGPIPRPGA